MSLHINNYLLQDAYQSLTKTLRSLDPHSSEAAFANWLSFDSSTFVRALPPHNYSILDYQHVAALGFLCGIDSRQLDQFGNDLFGGLNRIKGRSFKMAGTFAPFVTDVVSLLGIAIGADLGASELKDEVRDWMESFVPKHTHTLSPWKRCLAYSALKILGSSHSSEIDIEGDISIIRVALNNKGIAGILKSDDEKNAGKNLIEKIVKNHETDLNFNSLLFGGLCHILQSVPAMTINKPTIAELISVLERTPGAFRRWPWEQEKKTVKSTPQKWDIQHEYHVQSLLYFLLSPLFPDLEDEFYADQIGQKNPRADIGIPSLQLIIEVKFLRSTVKFADLVEEVAADNSLYFRTGSECRSKYEQMIVFVWDDSGRTQEYARFKQGVNQLSHTVGCVVIPRPGNMTHSTI